MAKDNEPIESGSDIEEFVSGASPFWDKWGNSILTCVLIVLVGIFGYRLYSQRQADQLEKSWTDLSTSTTPMSMATVASDNKGNAVGWIASLRAGNLYLAQARQSGDAPVSPSTQPSVGAGASKEQALTQAAVSFNEVINDPNADAVFKFNARLGMAAVEESKGNFDKAKEIYLAVQKEAKESFPVISDQAGELAKIAPSLGQKLVYSEPAPAPKVIAPANAPMINVPAMPTAPVAPGK